MCIYIVDECMPAGNLEKKIIIGVKKFEMKKTINIFIYSLNFISQYTTNKSITIFFFFFIFDY